MSETAQLFSPNISQALREQLEHHARFLRCPCPTSGAISHLAPDVCIAYSIMINQPTRHINIAHWFMLFRDATQDARAEADGVTRSRFSLALAQLKLCGFIKSTTRTGVVKRLFAE